METINQGTGMPLADERCKPCRTGERKLPAADAVALLGELDDWIYYPDRIEKRWEFKGYKRALTLVASIAEIAHQQDHHPEIRFGWGYVEVVLNTHSVGGLSRNDFIVAAQIDAVA
ncbi:MAG: 4a-hydroxytetrahydrobiopterin dehydratase [Rickettsiales bacterium]